MREGASLAPSIEEAAGAGRTAAVRQRVDYISEADHGLQLIDRDAADRYSQLNQICAIMAAPSGVPEGAGPHTVAVSHESFPCS